MTQKNIDKRTLFTILAALRHYQADLPRANIDTEILDIATEANTVDPLSEDEIDELCEDLNTLPLSLAKHPSPPQATLHAHDPASWLSTVWDALQGYREDCIPAHDPTYDEEWGDICSAMAWISAALGLPDETDTSPQPQTPLHIADVVEIVLSLARQNMPSGHPDHERQKQACTLLEDFAVNHLGDDSPPAAIAIPANHVLANALKLTIVCCLEALTADWDKSDDGFISLIDAAQDALTACGLDSGEHNYADTTPEQLEALQTNLSDGADLAAVLRSMRTPATL